MISVLTSAAVVGNVECVSGEDLKKLIDRLNVISVLNRLKCQAAMA